jgi:hypothetical protein
VIGRVQASSSTGAIAEIDSGVASAGAGSGTGATVENGGDASVRSQSFSSTVALPKRFPARMISQPSDRLYLVLPRRNFHCLS